MTPEFYQTLVDRCWRRSGSLMYRPNQRQSCCPHYTIRLDSNLFKPAKDQRQAVNRFNKFITGTDYDKEAARKYPRSRDEARKRDTEFNLVERIHECEADSLRTPPEPAHNFTVTLEEDTFTEEKFLVFENYQRTIHKESPSDITRGGFRRFLCDSPITRQTVVLEDGRQKKLGSFHQCYRLDGKLVAMGVLDLLPHSVSAVYFLYHESLHKFCPGKLGALREIALAREGDYGWWYPGYYIHSCPKMRYKMDYSPQYILDPESLTWDPLDKEIVHFLGTQPYLSLSREKRLGAPVDGVLPGEPEDQGDQASNDDEDLGGSGGTLFRSNMPGIATVSDMLAMDLDHIPIRLKSGNSLYEVSDLVAWDDRPFTEAGGLKSAIAELVAVTGADLLGQYCVDFSRAG